MNNSKQRKLGAILSYGSIIISTLVTLIYTPFMLRMIGQSEYGLYSLVASIIGYLTVLDLGFGNAIVVYTSRYRQQHKYEEEQKLHGMFLVIFSIIGVIAALIGVFLYFNVDLLFGHSMTEVEILKAKTMMLILTFNLAITFPLSIFNSIISAYEKFVFQKVLSIIRTLLNPMLMIPLLLLGCKAITMVLVITILNIGCLVINYIYCIKKLNIQIKFKGFDKQLLVEIFGYSFFIFLGVIVDKINWSVDQFVLGAVSGTIAVSLYSVATNFNTLFINLSTAISGVLLPKMSKMIGDNASDEQITDEFIKVGRLQYYIVFLMLSGFILVGKGFIIWWAGIEYTTSYYIAVILLVPLSVPLIQNLGLSIMQAKNMHKFRSVLLAIIALGNILISIPLAKTYGGIGSAIGTAVSLVIGNIIIINIYYYAKVKINVLKFWKEIIKMTTTFLIPIVSILIFMNITSLTGIDSVVVYGSIYTVIYCITAYSLSMNEYEKNIVNNVFAKFKKIFRVNKNLERIWEK